MEVIETEIAGVLVLKPRVFNDDRGYFFESYQYERYKEAGITSVFVQDNESMSTRGVVRGLHFQKGEFAQAKLVRVVKGSVYDVAVDLRTGSPTFGKWYGVELNEENKKQFYIPRGFAHGFSVLSDTAIFTYKCDNIYNQASEGSINPFDATIGVDWKLPKSECLLSEKDSMAPALEKADFNF